MSRYNIVIPADAPPWAQQLQADFNRVFAQVEKDRKPRTIAKANLPLNGSEALAIVPDEVGGSVLAFFDGAAWRRVTDRAVVS